MEYEWDEEKSDANIAADRLGFEASLQTVRAMIELRFPSSTITDCCLAMVVCWETAMTFITSSTLNSCPPSRERHLFRIDDARRDGVKPSPARGDRARDPSPPKAIIGDRLHRVVYTRRGDRRRIISLRKASPKEMRDYARA